MGWLILGIILGVLIGLFFLLVKLAIARESTAKAVMTLGEFSKIIFRWKRHWMDNEWNIWREGELPQDMIEGKGEEETNEAYQKRIKKKAQEFRKKNEKKTGLRILGGLYLYGIRGIHQIHLYSLRWSDIHQVEEKGEIVEKPVFHDEKALDHVMLRPAVYYTKLFKVETGTPLWAKEVIPTLPERIGVDVAILVTMRIVNPYNFLFVAPPTPIEEVIARLNALMRSRIGMMDLDSLLFYEGKSDILWHGGKDERILGFELPEFVRTKLGEFPGLKEEKLIKETLPKWGFVIAEAGVDIKIVDPPPEIQILIRARKEEDLKAEARGVRIARTLVEAEAQGRGKSKEEIQKEIDGDKNRQKEFREECEDLITRELAMEQGAVSRIEVPGGSNLEVLAALLGGNKLPLGRKGGRGSQTRVDRILERARGQEKEGG